MPRMLTVEQGPKRGQMFVTDADGRRVAAVIWRGRRSFEAVDDAGALLCRGVAQGGVARRWQVSDAPGAELAVLSLGPTGTVTVDLAGHGAKINCNSRACAATAPARLLG